MNEFMSTIDLERSLLRIITKSKMFAQLNINKIQDDFFTNSTRKFIFSTAKQTYLDTRGHLTRRLFEFELNQRIEQKDRVIYEGEWNLIEGLSINETAESLIDKLIEAQIGRKVMKAAEEVVTLLEEGDIERAAEKLKRSAMNIKTVKDDQPIRCLTDYEHRKKIILDKREHPEKYTGLKTGIFPTFDKKSGGFFAGEMTLIAGVTGLGKSTLLKAMQWGLLKNNPGINILHIANEEYSLQVENKFDSLITDIPYLDFKLGKMSDAQILEWEKKMLDMDSSNLGKIYSKEIPAFTDVTLIEDAYRELENDGVKIDIIFIDHLPHIVPILKAYGENDERWKAAGDCKELARSLSVPVVVPTQAATEVEAKQTRGHRAGKLDVYGSKGQIHCANNFLIITSRGKDNEQVDRLEYERDVFWLIDCKKNRDGPPFSFKAKHHVFTGKVEEVTEKNLTDDEEDELDQILEEANSKLSKNESKNESDSESEVVPVESDESDESDSSDDEISDDGASQSSLPSSIRSFIARRNSSNN